MRNIIVFASALFISLTSFAQIGIVGGLTSSSTNINVATQELSTKTINQYHIGITYKFGIGKNWAIQPAIIYNVKGASMTELTGVSDINFNTGYIEVPVQIQGGVHLGSLLRVYGLAEPFLGYAVTNKISYGSESENGWDNVKNRFEIGAALGAGVEILKHFQVNLKYYWNFGSLYGQDITFSSITKQISSSTCKGLVLSGVILF